MTTISGGGDLVFGTDGGDLTFEQHRVTLLSPTVYYGDPQKIIDRLLPEGIAIAAADSVDGVLASDDGLVVLQDGVLKISSALQAGPLLQAAGVSLGATTVARVAGATVGSTTTPTSLFASTISKPAAVANDVFRFQTAGLLWNLSGSSKTSTLTCQYASTNLWTPFAHTVANNDLLSYLIQATVRVVTVGSSVTEYVSAEVRITNNDQTWSSTGCRAYVQNPSVNNTGALGFTLTDTHSATGTFSTIGFGAFIEKIPAAA